MARTKSEVEEKFILLNKPFNGSWTYQDGNIAHEIIDFFLTDSGEYYVYNIPYGRTCNGRVPDYIVLTSEGTNRYMVWVIVQGRKMTIKMVKKIITPQQTITRKIVKRLSI